MAQYRIVYTRGRLGDERYTPEVKYKWWPFWRNILHYRPSSDNTAREAIHNHAHPRIVRKVVWSGTTDEA